VLHGNYSGTASRVTTTLDGIRAQFASAEISFYPGTNFLREQKVVPSFVLSTDDGQPGLKAECFDADDISGAPQVVRVDSGVNLAFRKPSKQDCRCVENPQPSAPCAASAASPTPTALTGTRAATPRQALALNPSRTSLKIVRRFCAITLTHAILPIIGK
jgi:hypothetical protein